MPTQSNFGYLPLPLSVKAGDIAIEPRPDFADAVARVERSGLIEGGWLYPPLPVRNGNAYEPHPYPATRFELPLTHRLQHADGMANEGLEFLISVTGFLLGYRLVPEGHGYLQRAPLDRAHSSDLSHVSACEMAVCLTSADRTWRALGAEQQRGLRATINGYQFAVAYRQRFEKFTFLYTALDAAWRFHYLAGGNTKRLFHWERPKWLCEALGIPLPNWAQSVAAGQLRLSETRNTLVHEAIFGGEPLGYAAPKDDLMLDMQALVSRAIVGALGISCGYTSSPVTSQQMHGLDLRP